MTEKYTPEKVAELIAGAERAWEAAGHIPQGTMVHETQWLPFANLYNVAESLIDVLTAVSADVEMWKQETDDAKAYAALVDAKRDRLHKAITEALATPISARSDYEMRRILRAALDKEGNDDGRM